MAERVTSFTRSNFAAQLGNTAQANEFYANIELPAVLSGMVPVDKFRRKIGFAIKAANVPDLNVAEIPVNFRSATVRIPGDRDASGMWEVTVRASLDNVPRDAFEAWNDALNGTVEHDVAKDLDLDVMQLFGVGEVHQLSRNGRIIKSWAFNGIWPSVVGAIAYDWTSANTIVEFPATFVFQHMETIATRNNLISAGSALSGEVLF
jgi:hypothetical protein